MKKKFLDSSMDLIKRNGKYNDEQLEVIAYGLETIYLTVTKLIILFGIAYLLGIVKEFIFLLISYNIIRSQAFGIHATKSIYCLISSLILFIGGSLICKFFILPFWFCILTSLVGDICLLLYAPADTYKRPLINKKKRLRWKILSVLGGIIYTVLIIVYKNNILINYLCIGMIEAVLMILPISYKIFNLPYNNYKAYLKNGV